MKIKILLFLCLILFSCKEKELIANDVVLRTEWSNDRKLKLEISDSHLDESCNSQPSSLFDNKKRIRFCYFKLYDMESNNIIYEISTKDEFEKNGNKCIPSNFPLAIAYGFDEFFDNQNFIFTDDYSWYAANEIYLYTYKFNWVNCSKVNLASIVEVPISYNYEHNSLFLVSNEKFTFAFYFYEKNHSLLIGKLPRTEKTDYSSFFNDKDEDDVDTLLIFKDNVEVVFKKDYDASESRFSAYKFPNLTFTLGKTSLVFDITQGKIKD